MPNLSDAFSEGRDPAELKRKVDEAKALEKRRIEEKQEQEKQKKQEQEKQKKQKEEIEEQAKKAERIKKYQPLILLLSKIYELQIDELEFKLSKIYRKDSYPLHIFSAYEFMENPRKHPVLTAYIRIESEIDLLNLKSERVGGLNMGAIKSDGFVVRYGAFGALIRGHFSEAAEIVCRDILDEYEKKSESMILLSIKETQNNSFEIRRGEQYNFPFHVPDPLPEGKLSEITMRETISKIIRAIGMVAPSKKQQIMPIIQEVEAELVRWEANPDNAPGAHPS